MKAESGVLLGVIIGAGLIGAGAWLARVLIAPKPAQKPPVDWRAGVAAAVAPKPSEPTAPARPPMQAPLEGFEDMMARGRESLRGEGVSIEDLVREQTWRPAPEVPEGSYMPGDAEGAPPWVNPTQN